LIIPTTIGHISFNENSQVIEHNRIISRGVLQEMDDITILHVNGTHYEMGYQHGWYLREAVQQNLRAFRHFSELSYEMLLEIWCQMEPYVPQQYIDEIQGLADGANVTFNDVVAAYMDIVWGDRGCFGFAAWGPATKDGSIIHTRSFDLPFNIKDPESGRYVHENHVLIIRHPDDGIASIAASAAGSMHGGGGINAAGIAIGQQVCWSNDQTYAGIPAMFRTQMVLDYADSIDEAIDLITSNSTLGWNFIISDSKIPIAYAVESTANKSYVGTYNDLIESTPPFWQMNHIVRRTNFFIDSDIAATQRHRYDPSGFGGLINFILTGEFFFVIWRAYNVMSTDLQNQWGELTCNSSISLMQEGYRGDTDLLLKIIIFLAEGTSFTRAWNQWTACYETGEYAVCFASHDKIAYYNPIHYFNLQNLFNFPSKS
jgi:hypothetical protein